MSSKRKAPAAASAEGESPDAKRRKLPTVEETPEGTTEAGLAFIAQIKQARDKRNHLISENFLALPPKRDNPLYYQEVKLPIALDIIEGKLSRHEYPTMTPVESDLRRMVSNAKSFNEKSSDIFSDAEKIRKLVSSTMQKINPAYADKSYAPFATPIPDVKFEEIKKQVDIQDVDAEGETDPEVNEKPKRPITIIGPSSAIATNGRRASSTPAVQDAEDAGQSFDGNTFQQAQEKIMTELMKLENDDGQLISTDFLNLPPRQLQDYYRIIKRPVCLKGVQKLVRGIKGREKPTGVSFFKSWHAFESELNYIWNNAREYNEDESEIVKLAGQVEVYFRRRLVEAKRAVPEPAQPKVKLRMSARSPEPSQPKLKLHFGASKPQAPIANATAGVAVDDEALKRQQDLVKAGANGHGAAGDGASSRPGPRNPFGGSHSGSGSTPIPTLGQISRSASAASPPVTVNGVKSEVQAGQSPALGAVELRRNSSASNEAAQSPHPTTLGMPPPSSVTPRLPSDASDALITNLSISTHPGLKIDKHMQIDIAPSPTMTQQSVTINLPPSHYYLRIVPTIASNLAHRQSKLFVTAATQRLNRIPQRPEETDERRPVYEARVVPGVNRIEVEMIAGPARGAPKTGPGQDVELEKMTVFVNLLRA
ncbi:Bromodomain [Lasallia pustulata]|uniref:Bromodomain n=1 Tax=Lasallia pustulata TaxID=136370 RepID=A0A1W5DAR7_9LECA|nr:Bromodomain [Lasallia pustulata]